ncbi:MAG: HD domain-containing protein, partial [Thermodesulfobacteriota bacterium]|nr:HD domain-containing protein [Thermodesulfobacteriota bacterium]
MTKEDLKKLKNKFFNYTDSFIKNTVNPGPFILKQDHTLRVCKEILYLGKELCLSKEQMLLAETTALLHDIGRFRQFKEYNTFLDQISEDHAALGLREIEKKNMLAFCTNDEKELIKNSIKFHNAAD